MENVLLVAYLLIVLALIAVILLQRSEGGGLGMGGGNSGGLMTVRGSANLLTRTTAILATLFFVTAIGLTIMADLNRNTNSILDGVAAPDGTAPATVLDALTQMQGDTTLPLPAGATSQPAAPAAATTSPTAPATTTETTSPAATTETAPAPTAPADPGLAVPAPAAPDAAVSAPAQ